MTPSSPIKPNSAFSSKRGMTLKDNEVLLNATENRIRYHPYGASKAVFEDKSDELLVAGPKGTGKAVALDTLIPTPCGYKEMGFIKVGDMVFSETGEPVPVVWVSPVMRDRPCYRVEFSDGSVVVADAEHLWRVKDVTQVRGSKRISSRYRDNPESIKTTREIWATYSYGKGFSRYAVDNCKALQYPERELPVHPYVLGCWLGGGDSNHAGYTSADPEIVEHIQSLGYEVTKLSAKYKYKIQHLTSTLGAMGGLNDKRMPEEYLRASEPQRLELLQGLMDTGGTCSKRQGICEFSTTSMVLALSVMRLLGSLGIKSTRNLKECYLDGKYVGIAYRLCFTTDKSIFKLSRKANLLPRWVSRAVGRRFIKSVMITESVPVKCIMVGSESHMYLVTDQCIPTHNSLGLLHKIHLVLSKYPESKGFMCRKTRTSMTNSCLDMFQKMVLKPVDKVHFHKQDQQFNYPNGSMLAVIGLDNVDRLNSSEWDIGYMQEATEASLNDWEVCTACIRHGVVPYQQMLADCNPDKPTHWLKVRVDQGLVKMYLSYHTDNPKFFNHTLNDWTPEGKRYIEKLKKLSGVRYKRLYLGEWAAAEGLVYDEYDPHTHLINRSDLPAGWTEWTHYWSIDFGFTHPLVIQDWMEDEKGRLYLNREYYRTQCLVEDATREWMTIMEGVEPRAVICDHDAEGRAVFERHSGYKTLPAYKNIQEGVQAVQKRLKKEWDGKPGLVILRDALVAVDESLKSAGSPYSTETEIDGYVWDVKVNRLVNSKRDEIPLDKDNHGMDATRYVVAFVDDLALDPAEEEEGTIMYEDAIQISRF